MMTNFVNGEPELGPDDLRLRVSMVIERGDGRVIADVQTDATFPHLFKELLYPSPYSDLNPEQEVANLVQTKLVEPIKDEVRDALGKMEVERPFARLDCPREEASWPVDDKETEWLRKLGESDFLNGQLESR